MVWCIDAVPFFDISIPLAPNALLGFAMFYSLIPYAFILLLLIGWIIAPLERAYPVAIGVNILSLILVAILRASIDQFRPPDSCVTSFGMPSGHSAVAIGTLVVLLVETIRNTRRYKTWKVIALCILWTVLLLPVPFARVIIHDHTVMQAVIGSLIGLGIALAVYAFLYWRYVRRRRLQQERTKIISSKIRTPF